MKVSVKKNIVALVAFVAIQTLFLLYRFSLAGVIGTVVVTGVLALKRFSKKYADIKELSPYLGMFVAGGIFNIALTETLFFFNDSFFSQFEKFSQSNYYSIFIWSIIVYIVLMVAFIILGKAISTKGAALRVIRHGGLFFLNLLFLCLILDNDYFNITNVIFSAVICIVFYFIDVFSNKVYNANTNSIAVFAALTSGVLMVCGSMHPRFFLVYIVGGMLEPVNAANWNWYTIAIVAAIFVVAAIVLFVFDNENYYENKGDYTFNDCVYMLLTGFNVVAYALTVNHYTKINYIFYLLLLVLDIVLLFVPVGLSKSRNNHETIPERILNNKFITALVLFACWLLLFITHLYGTMDIAIILILIVVLNAIFFFSKWVCSLSIVLAGVLSAVIAYHWHSSPLIYGFIVVFTILLAVFVFMLGIENKALQNQEFSIIMQYVVTVLAVVVLVFAFSRTGVKISTTVDNQMAVVDQTVSREMEESKNIVVELKAKAKDGKIKSCSYYWESNKKVVKPKLDEKSSFTVKNNGADTLVIVCTDSSGVISTYRHSFNIK